MRRVTRALCLTALCAALTLGSTGCFTIEHQVGTGAGSGATSTEARQWYILWGLIPLNNVSSKSMAGSVQDYTVKTERNVVDILINLFTGMVTVYSQSVTVTR